MTAIADHVRSEQTRARYPDAQGFVERDGVSIFWERYGARGAERAILLAAEHPERVTGLVFVAPALPLPPVSPRAGAEREFVEPHEAYEGWGKWNSHYWLEHYEDFVDFFFSQVFTEPHSTK